MQVAIEGMQALLDQDPVLIQQWHDICDCTEGNQGIFGSSWHWDMQGGAQGLDQLEGHPCPRQAGCRIGGVASLGIDHRPGLRQDGGTFMVVCNDHRDACRFQLLHSTDAGHTAVNRYQEPG